MTSTSTGTAVMTFPTDTQILVTREFEAPRHLVWRVWTTPELVKRWWSGKRGVVTLAEIDLRVGGRWRYVMNSQGTEIAFNGEFREIVPNERIVNTEVYEVMPDDPALNVVTFSEAAGRTTLELLTEVDDAQTRDMILSTGMEAGVQEQMEIIDELVASMP